MSSQFKQIEQPLKKVIQKMLRVVLTREEVEENYKKLAEIKHYDKLQRRELMEQKYCFADYESSESLSEEEQAYKNLDAKQLKYLIRQKLIKKKLCPNVLQKIVLYDPELEKGAYDEMQLDSAQDINDALMSGEDGEKLLSQVNEVYLDDERHHKNLKALKFIIEELQNIQNQSTLISH